MGGEELNGSEHMVKLKTQIKHSGRSASKNTQITSEIDPTCSDILENKAGKTTFGLLL